MFRVREVLGREVFAHGFWVTVAFTLIASIGVAALSWHVLEAPVQAWARRRTAAPVTGQRDDGVAGPRGGERHEEQAKRT